MKITGIAMTQTAFDFVVIGGGSAGSVLAGRLLGESKYFSMFIGSGWGRQ
jgi:pyruvate/2-oxoglutarate dehydrogenase complex dihydrolipoamide dehydrogenase (E3) component